MNPYTLHDVISHLPKALFKQLASGSQRHAKKRVRKAILAIQNRAGDRMFSRQSSRILTGAVLQHFA